ncbi:MAG: LON peptidase substrate-binding domain-containing protein [Pyrinomonadaceae bacterium]|nr:LON peptidase substrate-binding domain-containing protein [Pyrinomonadaceae bacterium]
MDEIFDRVRSVRELPLFPLPVVLFPGVPMPFHIFEPRYQQMLSDIRASNNLFGVSYFDASASDQDRPPIGHVGCAAEVVEVQQMPDGRSNILTVGLIRYRLEAYAERDESYLIGQVSFFEDEAEDEKLLEQRAREVSELFTRIARAVRSINDERASLPELPEAQPERLSFLVAGAMEMEAEDKQQLLELLSTAKRLQRIRDLLAQAVSGYEERARMHGVAKGNGHGGKKLNFE